MKTEIQEMNMHNSMMWKLRTILSKNESELQYLNLAIISSKVWEVCIFGVVSIYHLVFKLIHFLSFLFDR